MKPDSLFRQRYIQRNSRHWIALAMLLMVVASVIAYNLATMREQLLEQEQKRLLTQARVISQNMERQFESANLALKGVVEDMPYLHSPRNMERANKRLTVLADAMPGVRTIFTTDAAGTVKAANRPELIGQNFSHRAYFKVPQQSGNLDLLYISPPFKSVLNSNVFNISRIIPAPDGSFNGIVTAGIDPDYTEAILRSALYAPDMLNTIMHGSGMRFMTVPGQITTGDSLPLQTPCFLLNRHTSSRKPENIFEERNIYNSEPRMTALLTVKPENLKMDSSLVVISSRKSGAILEAWHREAFFQGAFFILTCVGSITGLFVLHRHQGSTEEKARRAEQLVQLRYQLLEYATMHTAEELLQHSLQEICRISESSLGFCLLVEINQSTLRLLACSDPIRKPCCWGKEDGISFSLDAGSDLATCIQGRAPLIQNGAAGSFTKLLLVPVFRDERVVAVFGSTDRTDDYSLKLVEEVSYLADVAWEVTETRRAQQELAASRQQLSDIFDFLPDATFALDTDGRVIAWNKAMEVMSKISKEETDGKTSEQLAAGFYGAPHASLAERLLFDEQNLEKHYPNLKRNGKSISIEAFCKALNNGKGAHVWTVAAPLHDTQGKRTGVIEAIRDISSIKQLELELTKSNELLANQARIDFLTGIYNRRMFDTLLTAEITRADRYNSPLSLIMMDLDHFKLINDNLGHSQGDMVLQKVAELVSGRLRSHDIFSRWGGEEFVLLTPKNDSLQAALLAEILRELIEQYDFGSDLKVTSSFGITSYRIGESATTFIERADTALYKAKQLGRNRVETV